MEIVASTKCVSLYIAVCCTASAHPKPLEEVEAAEVPCTAMELVAEFAATWKLCCHPDKKEGWETFCAFVGPWLSMSPPEYLFHSASTEAGGSEGSARLPVKPLKKSISVQPEAGGSRDMHTEAAQFPHGFLFEDVA
jgi:hypothetical protein